MAGAGGVPVAIGVNSSQTHQTIAGWGAEYAIENYSVPLAQRSRVEALIYGTVKLTTTQAGALLESPTSNYADIQNSDLDAGVINWSGFNGWSEQWTHDGWITLASTLDAGGVALTAEQLGLTGYVMGDGNPNVRWENQWLDAIRTSDAPTYLAYTARQVLADYEYWQNNYGAVPPLMQFGNEEISGNQQLYTQAGIDNYPGGSTQEMIDLIKAAGARLWSNGFSGVKFLVCNEERVQSSLGLAQAILADPTARQYVAAIGYHEYPYGSAYSDLSQVLGASGPGNPPTAEIQVRNQLRDLAADAGVAVWLTEVSHASAGGLSGASFDTLRGRAIDIHDNLIYADIASFWLQGDEWDTVSQQGHVGTYKTVNQLVAAQGGDMAVIGDPDAGTWQVTMGGYAIAHYARWVRPGAVRVDATSSDPLVQVAAFVDNGASTVALVVINNDASARTANIALSGPTFAEGVSGEQSTAQTILGPVCPALAADGGLLLLNLPADSVTSVSAPVRFF